MLSVFPSLFILSIFVPVLLRLVVGIFFFTIGYRHLTKEQDVLGKEFSAWFQTYLPFLAPVAKPYVVLLALIEILLGLTLIAGFLTQVAALIGFIYMIKLVWLQKGFPHFANHERLVYILFAVVLFSLLILGPGAPAVDLPL